ncbi:MAG: (2Fe-2S)-binding protein [Candidatus Hydrogenedentes bacterium]|nr:(2Fe-2S)-binding protein [Candidatus Hydrogenedentota bacterium]
MATVVFTLNGETKSVTTDAARTVLEVLREDLDTTGAKYGCGEGSCRACVVLVDGRPVTSCQTPLSKIEGKSVVTIEGLAQGDALHPVQEAFVAEGAMQCGYCVPGMILTAVALLKANPQPTRAQIVEFMDGNLCRCCNYPNIVRAIERAALQMQGAAK